MADKITIRINGNAIKATRGANLLKVLQENGCDIPTLCAHRDLSPGGTCRMCLVELESSGVRSLVTSCNCTVDADVDVFTESEPVIRNRKRLAEMYLGRFPNVPVIRELAARCGVASSRFSSPVTDPNPRACILCGRCVRACKEFVIERILDFAGKGINRHVAMPFNEMDEHCVGCSSCAYVCPTGAIRIVDDLNQPVNPQLIRDHGMKVNAEMATLDKMQNRMREVGTANIVEVMDKYELLPVMNYRFGSHPDTPKIDSKVLKSRYFTQEMADGCWRGCSMACAKAVDNYTLRTGPYKGQKVCVDGPEYETSGGGANMGCFDPDFIVEYNFYCDTYGIDTISFATTMGFVMEAFEAGQITEHHTGGLKLNFGAVDDALEVLHQMARGEGFGVDVGQGIRWLKEKWVREYGADRQFLQDIGMECKGLEVSEYLPKESLAQQAGYGLAIKGPQHDEAWLIFMDMVNNQIPTFEDKAEALYYFPLFRTWFGLMGLCKIIWNDVVPANNKFEKEAAKIPDHVNNYFKYWEGMTGIPLNEESMLLQSARVYNLQRVMSVLLGYGTREYDRMPYRGMGPVTPPEYEWRKDYFDKQLRDILGVDPEGKSTEEKIRILRAHREDQYEKVTDVVYRRRGWTKNGVPKLSRLKELGIDLPEIVAIVRDRQDD